MSLTIAICVWMVVILRMLWFALGRFVLMSTNVANCDKGDNADRNRKLTLSLLSGLSLLQENRKVKSY